MLYNIIYDLYIFFMRRGAAQEVAVEPMKKEPG